MARRRFFVNSIQAGAAELTGDDAHHLARVLRAESGQQYEICDGVSLWLAEIAEVGRNRVVFRTLEAVPVAPDPLRLTICAALFKFDRFEWMIEKITELGAARIVAFPAARSEKGLYEAAAKRIERWRKIARESSQQSRRLAPPSIEVVKDVGQALPPACKSITLFLDENPCVPALTAVLPTARHPGAEVAVAIGPEGGWTPAERDRALAVGWCSASLGPRILRAETAAVATAAILVAAWLSPRPIE